MLIETCANDPAGQPIARPRLNLPKFITWGRQFPKRPASCETGFFAFQPGKQNGALLGGWVAAVSFRVPRIKKTSRDGPTSCREGSGITSALRLALHLPVPFGMGGWGVLLGVGSGQTQAVFSDKSENKPYNTN